jgi:heme oxygenase
MRYVIEGSNLGARVIYRALQNSKIAQPIAVEKCYWSLAQTWQTSWPALLRQLTDLHTQDEWDEAANSACLVFEHFIHFLTPERK